MAGRKLYRDFETQEQIDVQYNLAAACADGPAIMAGWHERSEQCLQAMQAASLGVRYGPTLDEYLDIFPAGPGAPVHLFIHGGYWRRFGARDHAFLAKGLVEAGHMAVMVNYSLCPKVTIDEIVRQVRAAIAWAACHIADYGGDPSRITISGHSAGGHLSAMALLTDWAGNYGLGCDIIKSACLVSGLFDLRPLPFSYLQPSLQLTGGEIARNSPIDHLPERLPPMDLLVGGDETDEFRRQSAAMHAAWGTIAEIGHHEVAGRHHFDILEIYLERDSLFHRSLADALKLSRG